MSDVLQRASESIDALGCRPAEAYAGERTIEASGMQNGDSKPRERRALDLQSREGARRGGEPRMAGWLRAVPARQVAGGRWGWMRNAVRRGNQGCAEDVPWFVSGVCWLGPGECPKPETPAEREGTAGVPVQRFFHRGSVMEAPTRRLKQMEIRPEVKHSAFATYPPQNLAMQ